MDALNERFTPAAAAWENLEAPGLDGRRWFVVHTQPHNEMRAVANLHQQDFSTFCPSLRRTVRHARQVKTVLAPLFPNYIFVQLDTAIDRWRCINGTRGVVRLITQGDHPVPVPQCIVEDLQLRTASDGAVDWAASFKLGDAVMIADGPFAKFVGTLERLDAAGRVQVLLDLLGRSVRVSVRGQAISPVL
jgi:Transcription antiterminator